MKIAHFALLLGLTPLASSLHADDSAISLTKAENKVTVKIGDDLFTEYLFGPDRAKPILYPVQAPGDLRIVRNYPIVKGIEGEANDHPHHESLWYTHGNVNDVSFWELSPTAGKIVQSKLVKAEGNQIVSENNWVAPGGKRILTDTTTLTFHELDGGNRAIDYQIALHASDGDLVFKDTKEGSMGIRTHAALETKGKGHALNSEGQKDGKVWGEHAKWVAYWGMIDDKPVGLAIFDHPSNPRYPTTWHARDYGLVAANPFGLHDFGKGDKGAGDFKIKSGDTVTFKYRFLFYSGDAETAKVPAQFEAWSK
jgi:hypothetical protein